MDRSSTARSYDLAFSFALGSLIGRTVLVRVSLLNAVIRLDPTVFDEVSGTARLDGERR